MRVLLYNLCKVVNPVELREILDYLIFFEVVLRITHCELEVCHLPLLHCRGRLGLTLARKYLLLQQSLGVKYEFNFLTVALARVGLVV